MNSSKRLRILIVTPAFPYPLIWGSGIRVYQIVKNLARHCEVSLLTFARPDQVVHFDVLRETGASVHAVVRDEPEASDKRRAQLSSLVSPISFQRQSLASSEMQRAIDHLLANEHFDIIQVESSHMFGYDFGSHVPILLDEHNIEYELLFRNFKTERSPLRKLYNWIEYRKFRGEEQRSWKQADGCILTSEREEEILRQYAPGTPAVTVPNGVDTDYYRPGPTSTTVGPDPNSVVFVGLMSYRPNIGAAVYFAREVMPRLLRERPELTLTIVGAGPPDELLRLAGPNIVVTGSVPDTRPFLERAGVVVVPIQMGSGTRLKVLEGLAMCRPVVSTSLGCEGIAAVHGEHLLVADDPAEFARCVMRLRDDPALASRLTRNGRALVEQRYSWASVVGQLEDFISSRLGARSACDAVLA